MPGMQELLAREFLYELWRKRGSPHSLNKPNTFLELYSLE
jgi:hypothetical protein